MARRRREPEETVAVEAAAEPIRPEERIDPRLVLAAPADVQRDGSAAALAWAERHRLLAVKSDAEVIAEREGRAARRALILARRDARRGGLAEPEPADYLHGFNAAN